MKLIQHPNRLLRLYGNALVGFATWLIHIASPYADWYEMDLDEECEGDCPGKCC